MGRQTSTGLAVVIIAVLTLLFVISAVSGVERGVQWLSNFNMVLAVVLLLFILSWARPCSSSARW